MNTKLFIRRNVQLNRCPSCHEIASLRRSRARNIFERVAKYVKYKSYVCRKCGWRGRLLSFKLARNFIQLILFYLFTAVAAVYLVNKFLHNYFN